MELSKIEYLEIEDIDFRDYPDFTDAFIVYGECEGKELSEEEIDELNSTSEGIALIQNWIIENQLYKN